MLKRVDELGKKHAAQLLKSTATLNANKAIHVSAMAGLASIVVAFLTFASDRTLGTGMAVGLSVVFICTVLTGYLCLLAHNAI